MKRVLVMGDSVCSGYFPVMAARLKAEADFWLAPIQMNTSVDLLMGVKDFVLKRQPEIAVFASGVAETRSICFGGSERLVLPKTFARNVRCILESVSENSPATPVWITMAPVDERKGNQSEDFAYDNETVLSYNQEAKAVAVSLGVEVIDLYGIVKAAARAESCRPDGICFDERSSDYIAAQVGERLRRLLAVF